MTCVRHCNTKPTSARTARVLAGRARQRLRRLDRIGTVADKIVAAIDLAALAEAAAQRWVRVVYAIVAAIR
jgi:hypothetical protein